jgi:pyrroloquinoline-quinone synthase
VELWERLEDASARWNVLEHSFYRRWSAGQLTMDELATYAGQYRHAVVAVARASEDAARAATGADARELAAHAEEEAGHVELWDGFARAVGGDVDAPPTVETRVCAHAWARPDRDLSGTLVALYAIESAQPAIAQAKRSGLRAHYGIAAAATAYFDVHVERDREHAASGRRLLERRLDGADPAALAAEAEAVLRANWRLLDGVERVANAT